MTETPAPVNEVIDHPDQYQYDASQLRYIASIVELLNETGDGIINVMPTEIPFSAYNVRIGEIIQDPMDKKYWVYVPCVWKERVKNEDSTRWMVWVDQ